MPRWRASRLPVWHQEEGVPQEEAACIPQIEVACVSVQRGSKDVDLFDDEQKTGRLGMKSLHAEMCYPPSTGGQRCWCDGPQPWWWQHLLAADNCWEFHTDWVECVCAHLHVCKQCILCRRRDRRAVWLCWRVCLSGCREQVVYNGGAVAAKSESHIEAAEGDPQLLHSWDHYKKIQL